MFGPLNFAGLFPSCLPVLSAHGSPALLPASLVWVRFLSGQSVGVVDRPIDHQHNGTIIPLTDLSGRPRYPPPPLTKPSGSNGKDERSFW